MNELLKIMSNDMKIARYKDEAESDFAFRVCYSALGMWCLKMACNSQNGVRGVSKSYQTQTLNSLYERFSIIFPQSMDKFIDPNDVSKKFATLLRNIYEETGYLLTDDNNNNFIANFGRGLLAGGKFLFFGYPEGEFSANGLGVYTDAAEQECELNELLIRDNLTINDYIALNFNELDFIERDIDASELEFFNPLEKNKTMSKSWGQRPATEFTIARKSDGTYYRIIQSSEKTFLYADEQASKAGIRLIDYEYRRLLFALKYKYSEPIVVKHYIVDETYSSIYIPAHLPNREYYLLMLLGWPNSKYNIFDKSNFLFRTEFLPIVGMMLNNLGVKMVTGGHNG